MTSKTNPDGLHLLGADIVYVDYEAFWELIKELLKIKDAKSNGQTIHSKCIQYWIQCCYYLLGIS